MARPFLAKVLTLTPRPCSPVARRLAQYRSSCLLAKVLVSTLFSLDSRRLARCHSGCSHQGSKTTLKLLSSSGLAVDRNISSTSSIKRFGPSLSRILSAVSRLALHCACQGYSAALSSRITLSLRLNHRDLKTRLKIRSFKMHNFKGWSHLFRCRNIDTGEDEGGASRVEGRKTRMLGDA
ncbi:hypothetical protein DFH08DRAFT_935292 [Mycena albidolilacea]|uniref:Uncharacterized protein n=1 Tax=Mycena albidolilacea TaxID=1033008 RepID=A0AAD7A664_9AGAR|nr:hypothetical protein DFH08DRAFT_935292 [Mycena albidolilacea]